MALQILIVDDSPAMRTFIRRVVRLSGARSRRIITKQAMARRRWRSSPTIRSTPCLPISTCR